MKTLGATSVLEYMPTSIKKQRRYLSFNEAAELLPWSAKTLRKKVALREIPHSRRCGKVIFDRLELEAWIAEGRVQTRSEILAGIGSAGK